MIGDSFTSSEEKKKMIENFLKIKNMSTVVSRFLLNF